MTTKQIKIPDRSHPITIERMSERVFVQVAGLTIADSSNALKLQEAAYSPVFYIPVRDVDMSKLAASTNETYCPYKGDCSYYDIPAGGERSKNAVWTYRSPYEAVSAIAGHVAFYPERVDSLKIGVSA